MSIFLAQSAEKVLTIVGFGAIIASAVGSL
nr:MAG TPA: hypothetical protein [Bacteriophage sp.]